MKVIIKPSLASGTVKAPPSKSMAHRLIICAGLAAGESTVSNIAYSEDVLASIDCIRALGAVCNISGDTATVTGTDITKLSGNIALPCRECGSTLRFFIPICEKTGADCHFTGSAKLFSRPLSVYEELAQKYCISYHKGENGLDISGKLPAGEYYIRGDISSQFISGLLLSAPISAERTVIHVLPPFESKPYVAMTVSALAKFGIAVNCPDENTFVVDNQRYTPASVTVEGDFSNAAFLDALTLVGGNVTVTGLDENSPSGDKVYKEHFAAIKDGFTEIDLTDCPDLAPILFALSAYFHGAHFTGTRRLRIKESDRAAVMAEELAKLGADISVEENEVTVHAAKLHTPHTPLFGHNDHRIVMALSILLTRLGGSIIGAEAVKKSYPDFFEVLHTLGADISEENDERMDQ